MCGLVGGAGDLDIKAEKAFKTLLVLDSVRGIDSTGVAIVHKNYQGPINNECHIAKVVGNPYELFETLKFEKVMKGSHKVMIGHNRFATQGKVNASNAHPFDFDDVVGAHNGTLQNKHVLDGGGEYAVDSQALLNHIGKFGVQSAVKNLAGAWAVTWWNKKEGTMNFIRNGERPLFICYTEDGKQMFWASEKWMLTIALSRHDIKIQEPFMLNEDVHLSVVLNPNHTLGKEEVVHAKSEYVPFVQQQQQGTGGWTQHPTSTTTSPINQQTSMFNRKPLEPPVDTKKNNVVTPGISAVSAQYSGKKGRVLKALSYYTDTQGGGFFQVFDKEYPSLLIRLYIQRNSIEADWLGKEFIGDISVTPTYLDGKLFHKVIHSSTKLLLKPAPVIVENDDPVQFLDSRGIPIDEKDWRKKYSFCCVCDGNIDPRGVFRFTKGQDDVLCSVCMTDESVTQYMNI